ncbi:hypothetical protein ACA910_001671 [Epithemia clementina (nom. ined.)]
MVMQEVFGVQRDIDIDPQVFPTPAELKALEAPLGDLEHGWFDSCTPGSPKLHYRSYLPKSGKPKAIIVFLNGVTSHSGEGFELSDGRKTNVALLAQVFRDEHEIAFYSFDLYGHGYSEGTRFFIPSWEQNLQDYMNFIKMVDDMQETRVPTFLYGQSYGGTLTLHAARRIQDNPSVGPQKFAGILLSAPAIIGDLPPPPVYWCLRYFLAPLFPKWTPFFMPNPISPDRIWKDEEMRAMRTTKRKMEMKLTGNGLAFRLGTALSLVQALDAVRTKTIPGLTVPLYVMHGTNDDGVPLEGTEFLRKTISSPSDECVFHYIEGGYHDLLSETKSKSYLEKTLPWIERRIKVVSSLS